MASAARHKIQLAVRLLELSPDVDTQFTFALPFATDAAVVDVRAMMKIAPGCAQGTDTICNTLLQVVAC